MGHRHMRSGLWTMQAPSARSDNTRRQRKKGEKARDDRQRAATLELTLILNKGLK